MSKSVYVTTGILVAALLFSSAVLAQGTNSINWKVTIDQKQISKNYHVVNSFIDASNNSVLGSTQVNYPAISSEGHAYANADKNGQYPVGYFQASFAQLASGKQTQELYSVNCYDLNRLVNQTVYLNFPQDFTNNKPNCGKS